MNSTDDLLWVCVLLLSNRMNAKKRAFRNLTTYQISHSLGASIMLTVTLIVLMEEQCGVLQGYLTPEDYVDPNEGFTLDDCENVHFVNFRKRV